MRVSSSSENSPDFINLWLSVGFYSLRFLYMLIGTCFSTSLSLTSSFCATFSQNLMQLTKVRGPFSRTESFTRISRWASCSKSSFANLWETVASTDFKYSYCVASSMFSSTWERCFWEKEYISTSLLINGGGGERSSTISWVRTMLCSSLSFVALLSRDIKEFISVSEIPKSKSPLSGRSGADILIV